MTSTTLIALLTTELFHAPLPSAPADWSPIFTEANRHCVTALLYPSLKRLHDVPEETLSHTRRAALFSAGAFDNVLRSQAEIVAMLAAHNVPCGILKGTSVACCYPHPELRLPGDIDILVGEESLSKVCDLLIDAGYTYSHTTELHTCFHKNGVEVEVHSAVSLFPENSKGTFAKQHMRDALQHVETAQIQGISFPVLSGTYQLIALLSHMERHLSACGIGLRQMCDWAVSIHAQRDRIGEDELSVIDQCGLLQFAKVSTRLCEKYLGLPPFSWCADVDNDLCDALMRDILDAGNFQAQRQTRYLSNVLTDTSWESDGGKPSTLRTYFHYIHKRMQQEHPWAKSLLWVPAFGVYYPIRWIVRMLPEKSKRKCMTKAVQSAKYREKLMRELSVYK